MSWVKLDDSFSDHPKVLAAGNEAIGLYCRALAYSGRQLTNGFIPTEVAGFLGRPKSIAKLVEVGLWEEVDRGYQVHDYLDWNRSREEVEKDRAKNAKRQRDWRERNGATDTVTNGGGNGTQIRGRSDSTGAGGPDPPDHASAREGANGNGGRGSLDPLTDEVTGILERGVASLSANDHGRPWPSPRREAIRRVLAEHDPDPGLATRVAREVREIIQAQDRAPNVAGLYGMKVAEAVG